MCKVSTKNNAPRSPRRKAGAAGKKASRGTPQNKDAAGGDPEICPVCDGSGALLSDVCPLCDGDRLIDVSKEPVSTKKVSPLLSACHETAFEGSDIIARPKRPPLNPKSPLCLVLDIDGTLLSESESISVHTMRSMLRPCVHEFLDFAFASFSAVAIWTAGSSEWLRAFLEAVDPDGERSWAFTWSFERISWLKVDSGRNDGSTVMQHVKRLQKIWKNNDLRAKGFSPHTTLLVDNNPSVCLTNYGNAVYIKTYTSEDPPDSDDDDDDDIRDDWLLVLMDYLANLNATQCPGNTVRHIDKRGWYTETKSKGRAHSI